MASALSTNTNSSNKSSTILPTYKQTLSHLQNTTLQSTNRKPVDQLQTLWKKYNINQRIQTAESNSYSASDLQQLLNGIDCDITRAMLQAERRVRKAEKPPWSPELKQASLSVKYYKLL